MRKFILSLAVVVTCMAALPAFAHLSEANFTPQGSGNYAAVSVSEVEVFAFKPDFPFKVIGVIEARGMYTGGGLSDLLDLDKWTDNSPIGEKEDIALAMKALLAEAARVGANGVVIVKSQQVRADNQGGTARRIVAAAIRYEKR